MIQQKYQGCTREFSADGSVTTFIYFGSQQEMLELQNSNLPGIISQDGLLKSSRLTQSEGDVWSLEMRFETGNDGSSVTAPSATYGSRSATLKSEMRSIPLENHPSYRTNWNHYLAAAPDVSGTLPVWYQEAADSVITGNDAQKYAWITSLSELPSDSKGRWSILCEPLLKGVDSYDAATYSITEAIRCRTASAAGDLVANKLNRLGTPENQFGISGGNWKCSDAAVSWSGKFWLATLTWTRSVNNSGWNEILYAEAEN